MESETPKANQEHNKSSENKCSQSCDTFKDTFKKWRRDPNGWIAICTICLVLIGFRAFRISEDTEKRQLRAYVAPTMQSSWIKHDTILSAEYTIENFGQTPAKNCKIRGGKIEILPFPLPKGHEFQIPLTQFEQKSRIDPKGTTSLAKVVRNQVFTKSEIAEITAPDTHRCAYVFGVLTYEDIFGDVHFTNFCSFLNPYSITPNKDATGQPIKNFTWADCDQHTDFN